MIYFVILDYGNLRKKKSNEPNTLMSHFRNVHHNKGAFGSS